LAQGQSFLNKVMAQARIDLLGKSEDAKWKRWII
jgi:hypothetical protein